jgi:hypothetical protein
MTPSLTTFNALRAEMEHSMRSIAWMCSIVIGLSVGQISPVFGSEPKLFLSVVLDASPTTTDRWETRKALLLEAIHSLQVGDRVELVTARPGQPTIQLAETIAEPLQLQREMAARSVARIPKEWLVGADVGRAVNAAYLSLLKRGEGYRCCLLVLSNGRIGEGSLAELRRVATALKPRGWPVCVVCDGEQANRPVLVAGTKGAFELRFIDSAALGEWIKSVRASSATNGPVTKAGGAQETVTPPAVVPAKPPEVPRSTPASAPSAPANTGPLNVRIVDMPRMGGDQSADRISPRAAGTKLKDSTASAPPAVPPQKGATQKTKNEATPRRKLPIALIGGGGLGIGLAGLAAYILFDVLAVGKLRHSRRQSQDSVASAGGHLVAFVGDRREEYGNLDDIREITIGKGLGSHIFIDQPGVEDRHARIFRRRSGLWIQNTAGTVIVVGGLELPPKAKTCLVLPADIELAPGVTVSLLTEPIALEMEVDTHENDVA